MIYGDNGWLQIGDGPPMKIVSWKIVLETWYTAWIKRTPRG